MTPPDGYLGILTHASHFLMAYRSVTGELIPFQLKNHQIRWSDSLASQQVVGRVTAYQAYDG